MGAGVEEAVSAAGSETWAVQSVVAAKSNAKESRRNFIILVSF